MKFNEYFRIGGVTQIIGAGNPGEYLTISNAHIYKTTLNEDSVTLFLRRESDGIEATSTIRVLEKFKDSEKALLNWAFGRTDIMGLTPEQVLGLDADIQIKNL